MGAKMVEKENHKNQRNIEQHINTGTRPNHGVMCSTQLSTGGYVAHGPIVGVDYRGPP